MTRKTTTVGGKGVAPKRPIPITGLQGVPRSPALPPLMDASSVGTHRADHTPEQNQQSLNEVAAMADFYGGGANP